MKTLICSDIHDHVQHLETALKKAADSACDSVICCGDLCSPFIMDIFHENCPLPVHIVFGNNDCDKFNMRIKCEQFNSTRNTFRQIYLHGEYFLKERGAPAAGIPDDVGLAVYHYHDLATPLATSGKYQLVCTGHTHKPFMEQYNNCILVNPGSLMGYIPSAKAKKCRPTCMIATWNPLEIELVEL